jgi:hypothetical protein
MPTIELYDHKKAAEFERAVTDLKAFLTFQVNESYLNSIVIISQQPASSHREHAGAIRRSFCVRRFEYFFAAAIHQAQRARQDRATRQEVARRHADSLYTLGSEGRWLVNENPSAVFPLGDIQAWDIHPT